MPCFSLTSSAVPVDDANNKRKMKEVMEEPSSTQHQRLTMPMNVSPLQPHLQQLLPSSREFSSPLQFNFNSQQQQQQPTEPDNLDKFLTKPFTSFTALLTEDDDSVPVPVLLRNMHDQIDQITKSHSGEVRNMLLDVYRRHYNNIISAANQEAEKKLMEKEEELKQAKMKIAELEQTVGQLTYQTRFLQTRVGTLERRSTVQDAVLRLYAAGATREDYGGRSEAQQQNQEDAESSFVDPNRREEPANMGPCRACFVADAAAIMLPCRHLCVCAPCAAAVNACPVCQTPKLTTYDVLLP
ncbi:hypothetical protein HAX54_032070 [Datura stramonium]|uniref:RING-type domain-containing protein n=1 Tax=Datura stramonium TaxID=4076 RepID=A0ABS8VCQ7_DATST|nr:hypothetical protein [Datura stramonium]